MSSRSLSGPSRTDKQEAGGNNVSQLPTLSLCNALDEKSPLRRGQRRQLWHLWPRQCRSRSGRTCLLMKLHRLKKAESVGDSVSLSLSQQRIGRFLVFSPSVPHSLLRLRFTFPRRRFMVLHSLRLYGTLLLSAPSRVGFLISWVMDFSGRGGNIFIHH